MKRKTWKRTLSYVLALVVSVVLMLGMLPRMRVTVNAANDILLTTIMWNSSLAIVYSNNGIVTLDFDDFNGVIETEELGNRGSGVFGISNSDANRIGTTNINLTAEGYVITKVVFWDYNFTENDYDIPLTDLEAPFGCYLKSSERSLSEEMSDPSGTHIVKIEVFGSKTPSVSISPNTEQSIYVDGHVSLTATVSPEDATASPDEVTDKTVKWSVGGTDADAVKLYSDENCTTEVGTAATSTLTVYAKGISEGSAIVTATSNLTDTKFATCAFTVTQNPDQLAADAVIAKIDAIGTAEYTDACKGKLDEARKAYDALTDAQKDKVTNYSILTDAEKKYEELKKAAEAASGTNPTSEIKPGTEIKDQAGNETGYVVTDANRTNLEVEYKGCAVDRKAKKLTIADEVMDAEGNVYRVTSIRKDALKNARGNTLVIGKNIRKIGKRALKGARYKKIIIKTKKNAKIKIDKKAFAVKNNNCIIKIKGARGKYKKKIIKKISKQVPEGVRVK